MTEELVPMPVEREPLEEPADVEDSVAPPLEHFHAVVETPNKPTRLPTLEVIRDLGRLSIDHPKKAFNGSIPCFLGDRYRPSILAMRGRNSPNTFDVGKTGPWRMQGALRAKNCLPHSGASRFGRACTTASITSWITWRRA